MSVVLVTAFRARGCRAAKRSSGLALGSCLHLICSDQGLQLREGMPPTSPRLSQLPDLAG